jgi:hypothetical protein
MTGYRKFAALLWKEFRSLRGPGIALIGLMFAISVLSILVNVFNPSFYHNNFMGNGYENVYMRVFIVYVSMLLSPMVIAVMWGIIYGYGLIREHTDKTRIQLASLTVSDYLTMSAKIGAVFGWAAAYICVSNIIMIGNRLLLDQPSPPGITTVLLPIHVNLLIRVSVTLEMLFPAIGLVTCAYILAFVIGRLQMVIGSMVFIGGFILFFYLRMLAMRPGMFSWMERPDTMTFGANAVNSISQVLFSVAFAAVVVVPSLALYARYREV